MFAGIVSRLTLADRPVEHRDRYYEDTQRGERKQAQWVRAFLILWNLSAICKDYVSPTQHGRVVALKPRTYH